MMMESTINVWKSLKRNWNVVIKVSKSVHADPKEIVCNELTSRSTRIADMRFVGRTPAEPLQMRSNTVACFVKNASIPIVSSVLIKLFEISDPPWFEKAFVFCSECSRQLTVVYELEKVMKEVERRLKESEKVVQD
ncbi:hypothetical protein Ocin01_17307 [Orchesella cincta]|uniref:Uncharacterized protein n=1 Tax=Orchesella cincta TaxID=48709 RepID=A0A1D2M8W2_ORCCI|nr:hypothetical protein Ocin01_17307 [Orchesella cincta]